jgi:hypothetical protein
MYDLGDYSFDSLVNALSVRLKISPASAWNLISEQVDDNISEILEVVPSALDNIMEGQADPAIASKLGMTFADLDNLMNHYGSAMSVGLILGYLIGKNTK